MKKFVLTIIAGLMTIVSFAQDKGRFEMYDFDNFKLHVYYTNDVMADASYIVEGENSLVTMEYPLFKENATEFEGYISKLGKPIEQVITDYHEGSSGELTQAVAEGMPDFMKGAVYGGMMTHFKETFGDAMVSLPTGKSVEIPFDSTQEWAGVQFKFLHGATSDFPAASILIGEKVYYTHWTPAKAHISHLQISSPDAIDAEIAESEKSLKSGATLFIGGHGGATKADAVQFKIDYLNTVKKLLAENKTPETFIEAMKKAYLDLPEADGLVELAKALYK